ncbi:MAG: glycosyltransferase [Gammaproteobacteria bacterium]
MKDSAHLGCSDDRSTRVSIIIPVYNGSNHLSEAIDSALAQAYPNIEVLAINDGSSDRGKTEDILKSYGSQIRYINKTNGGVASALNAGIREMEGAFFSWLSHDDLYLPDKIEVQMEYAFKADRATVYYSDFETIAEKGQSLGVHAVPHLSPPALRPSLMLSANLHGCSLLVPRQAFEEIGLFDESLRTTQDYDLWFKMATRFPFEHVPKVLVRARLHKDQGIHQLKGYVVREINDLYRRYLPTLTGEEIAAYWPAGAFSYFRATAMSMWKRGYRKAAIFALLMACRHLYGSNIGQAWNRRSSSEGRLNL